MLAWELSASMAWAREMRGIASMASAVAPALARARIVSGAPSGFRKPTRTLLAPSFAISSLLGAATLATTSAVQTSSPMVAPASVKRSSAMLAPAPAPDWTRTSWPWPVRRLTTSGTSATRRSRSAVSLGTPTLMGRETLVHTGEAEHCRARHPGQRGLRADIGHGPARGRPAPRLRLRFRRLLRGRRGGLAGGPARLDRVDREGPTGQCGQRLGGHPDGRLAACPR